ncbi:MAG: serine hydrolase [Candidatus Azobacteroides sp.]|nr:serine hydrolase [Candidatus Azobacteroides sp.]
MKRSIVIGFLFLLLTGAFASAQRLPNLYQRADQQKMNQWVDSVFDSMTLDEQIGQLIVLKADPGASYRTSVIKNIKEYNVGGILFTGGDLFDQAESTNIYQETSRIPLWVTFDGEWGLSMRLKDTPNFPRNMTLGAIANNDLIRLYGEEMGRECRELGIHVNFAPVLDVNDNPSNPVIGNRSFGENQQAVSEKGIAYAKGLESRNIISVGKHFPGHGNTSEDSHKTLPVVKLSETHLEQVELYPFAHFIQEGFTGIMTGHLSVPALDNSFDLAASLSPEIVTGLLKNKWGFTGLTFTDALEMKGAVSKTGNTCVQALLAGNDVLVAPGRLASDFTEIKKSVESGVLNRSVIEDACRKILQYKYITGLNQYKPIEMKGLKQRIYTDYTEWLIQKLNNEAVTLLKNNNNVIPIKESDKNKTAVLSIGVNEEPAFAQRMALYDTFDFFRLDVNAAPDEIEQVFTQLKNYSRIICGIHTERMNDFPELQSLAKEKEVHLCFFTTPYTLCRYEKSIASAQSVLSAYENTPNAQNAAAEVLMGGIPAKGKLPVTVSGIFEYGTGLKTNKVRLSYQKPQEVNMDGNTLKKIASIVNEGIKNQAFPGCQILIAKDGVVVYNQSFGFFDYANTHAVQNSDVYDLASVTKTLATLPAVMKLTDTKKIALSDKISQFVPELKNTNKQNLTIRNALFHETGLPASLPFYKLLIDENSYTGPLSSGRRNLTYRTVYDTNVYMRTDFEFYPSKVSKTPQPGISKQVAENFYITDGFSQEILNEIVKTPLNKKKGYLYSDLNFVLLQKVIENCTGQPLNKFLEANFYRRLGAYSTCFLPLQRIDKQAIAPTENDEFLRNQILIGYTHDETAALMGGVSGNAGLFSNANDLAKILQMFLNFGEYGGERYLSQETVRTFTQTKSPVSRRGLGFDKPDTVHPENSPTAASAPASVYGHTGFTGTCFWVDPDNQLIYIFLSNRVYPSRTHKQLMEMKIRPRIQDIIYEAIQ